MLQRIHYGGDVQQAVNYFTRQLYIRDPSQLKKVSVIVLCFS
jgi:hypothetical protein